VQATPPCDPGEGGNFVFAIVETGGKQYKVQQGSVLRVEKIEAAVGDQVVLDKILGVDSDGAFQVGTPYLSGARVTAEVLKQGKAKKILVFKYKAKKNYRRRQGHRQLFTELIVREISLGGQEETPAAAEL
jgi:large subunit ribosomal protein L21